MANLHKIFFISLSINATFSFLHCLYRTFGKKNPHAMTAARMLGHRAGDFGIIEIL